MKVKCIKILIGTFLIIVLLMLFNSISKTAQTTSSESAYSALETSLVVCLNDYYRINGEYPNSLDKLTDIEYSDGATPEILTQFNYIPNKDRCEISHISPLYMSERTTYLDKGKIRNPATATHKNETPQNK